jgi:molybdopterin-containing oxidoreductase family iron-sulfur binding subunit
MNRLYAVETTPGLTGAAADHRLPLRASEVEGLARLIASRIGVAIADGEQQLPHGVSEAWVAALVSDLQSHRGTSLVIAGVGQPPAVHALVHAMNRELGSVGQTVEYVAPAEAHPVNQSAALKEAKSRR